MDYEHTQTGLLAIIVTVFFAAVFALTAVLDGDEPAVLVTMGAATVAILAVVWAFNRLRVTVDATRVTVRFGLGWPSRAFPLEEVTAFRPVRNKWWYGLGIRMLPGGVWMFNLWGLDAVDLELESGKRFRIGTDDVEGLIATLEMRTSLRPDIG